MAYKGPQRSHNYKFLLQRWRSLCREIARQKLEKREGVQYVKGETEPFTGTAFLSYANGSKSEVTPYVDGKINGTEINYYENGSKYGVTPL